MLNRLRFLLPDHIKQKLLFPGYYGMLFKKQILPFHQKENIKRITAGFQNEFGGYFNIPISNVNGDVIFHGTNLKALAWPPKNRVAICLKMAGDLIGKPISYSNAWNWQQGSMTRWIDDYHIGFNHYDESTNEYCFCIVNKSGKNQDVIPLPLGAIDQASKNAISYSFERLSILRPDYGYFCRSTVDKKKLLNEAIAFSLVDLTSKREILSVSFAELRKLLGIKTKVDKVNHFEFNPSGNRVAYLYRFWENMKKQTVFINFDIAKKRNFVIGRESFYSHFCWLNDFEILVFGQHNESNKFFVINTYNNKTYIPEYYVPIVDSHPSINGGTIIFDSYPSFFRKSQVELVHTEKNDLHTLFTSLHHPNFRHFNRIDHHPRISADGKYVFIDYPNGQNRAFGRIKLK